MENIMDFLAKAFSNKNVRRWAIEGCISLAVGIIAGCITFNLLSNEKKSLKVSEQLAEAPAEDTFVADQVVDNEDPDEDVVIEVVEGSSVENVYADTVAGWSDAEIDAAITERSGYISKTKYAQPMSKYWEETRGVTDVAWQAMYMYDTDKKVYTAEDFSGLSPAAIHIAKNEIYARHGYSFNDKDLYNYFMCMIWYSPAVMPTDFSEEVFTETEVKNLDLLNSLDTYQ